MTTKFTSQKKHRLYLFRKFVLIKIIAISFFIICNCISNADNRDYQPLNIRDAFKPAERRRSVNPIYGVVVFTHFKGETLHDTIAPKWADELFSGEPGSVTHFFDTVSFGQYSVTGTYLPKYYEMPHDSSYYDNIFLYTNDIIDVLNNDPDVDFAQFDNDGPDGIPGSMDDDGWVDYLVLMPYSRPYDFIENLATGVFIIGLKNPYQTDDRNARGDMIKLDSQSGCIAVAPNKNQAVGTIIAELCHAHGAVDLMDKTWLISDPSTDSAGIGFWGILGRGALGWDERDGPMGPCAYNRMKMNCIGVNNENIVDLYGVNEKVRVTDVASGGNVYRLRIDHREYFLIEHRRNDGFYYDRKIPKNGLLIWHIYDGTSNSDEMLKLCDLECADGRYLDAGFPGGTKPDSINGRDNLDFWAHNSNYAYKYEGNQGDRYDVFDGVWYTAFGTETNPGTHSNAKKISTGIEVFNIHAEGDKMVFDCIIPPIREPEKTPYIGIAFQRTAGVAIYNLSRDIEHTFYILNFGIHQKSDVLVTVTADTLTIENIHSLEYSEAQRIVERRLLNMGSGLQGARIYRQNIDTDEFTAIIQNFGVRLEDIGSGAPLKSIQRVYRISNTREPKSTIELFQNYPNPFKSDTWIPYLLSHRSPVLLEVYNILGQRVLTVEDEYKFAGYHRLRLNASHLATGIYLYRIKGTTKSGTKKLMIIR